MADFKVPVVRIKEPVEHHPDADKLSIVRIGGYLCISAKLDEDEAAKRGGAVGDHRYSVGDLVVYIPEAAVVPEALLRSMGFWKEDPETGEGRGMLDGTLGNRVKARKLRGIFSQGILFPVEKLSVTVSEGDDVADILGIAKYEPPTPTNMDGEVCPLFGVIERFDFESIQSVPDLFEPGEPVVATEKLHGTFFQAGYVPGLNDADCFMNGDVYVSSKGLGNKGLGFKDNEANVGNLYVRALRKALGDGLFDRFRALSEAADGKAVRVFGEIFGTGVQDLSYGAKEPTLRLFDVKVGDDYLPPAEAARTAVERLGLDFVPSLYEGPYDLEALAQVRDGKSVLGGDHIREGVVIRSATAARHPNHGRKIGKWVSPDYLLRKGKKGVEVTEFQ